MHDAETMDGRLVQIKATQTDRVAISECPDFLIVLKIAKDGSFEGVYNGPGAPVWEACGKMQKTGQRHVSVSKLRALNGEVAYEDKALRIGVTTAFCREWLPCLGEPMRSLTPFIKAAFDSGIVVGDYSARVEGIDQGELADASPAFVARLDAGRLLGAIAWHFRHDYWDNGAIEESIETGALPRLMEAFVSRYDDFTKPQVDGLP